MFHSKFSLLVLSLSIGPVFCFAAEPNANRAKAIAEIEKLGGKVTVDEKTPGTPVIGVGLCGDRVTDAGLEYLRGFTGLQSLDLRGTQVTDAGLQRVERFTGLQSLTLFDTKVTDAGMKHLRGLRRLRSLDLLNTHVTDAGLGQIQGLVDSSR